MLYFASDASSFTTGAVLAVDGGAQWSLAGGGDQRGYGYASTTASATGPDTFARQPSLPTFNWLHVHEPNAAPATARAPRRRGGRRLRGGRPRSRHGGRLPARRRRTERLVRLLRRHRLACTDVGVLVVDQPNAQADAASLAELARATGARVCIAVFDSRPTPASLATLERCSEQLAEAGARLALEFVAYTGVATLGDAVEVCGAVGWERCGVLLDSWHFFRGGAPWGVLRSMDGGQLALVHVNDGAPPAGDDPVLESRYRRLPAGRGDVPAREAGSRARGARLRGRRQRRGPFGGAARAAARGSGPRAHDVAAVLCSERT